MFTSHGRLGVDLSGSDLAETMYDEFNVETLATG